MIDKNNTINDNGKFDDNAMDKYGNNNGNNNNVASADNQLYQEVEINFLHSSTYGELILTEETALTFWLAIFVNKHNHEFEIVFYETSPPAYVTGTDMDDGYKLDVLETK